MSESVENRTFEQLTFLLPASPVRTCQWPENEQDWQALAAACSGKLSESWESLGRLGLFSKTSPACFLRITEKISALSSNPWMGSGMAWRGVCLTRSFSESPKDAAVCSLSEVLEGHVPKRFFLSPRAAKGILRRAEKRGRELPQKLAEALASLAKAGGEMESERFAPKGRTDQADQAISQSASSQQPLASECADKTTPAPITCNSRTQSRRTCGTEAKGQQTTSSEAWQPTAESTDMQWEHSKRQNHANLSVRRLTPTECELLQGFQKGWTVPDTEHWGTRLRRKLQSGSEKES